MAQKSNQRRQAPTYSSDTMALRYMGGLALAALGALLFMAVDLGMGKNGGSFFPWLRSLARGLSGSMAYVLPVIPLWAGGLVIWSTQRKAPVKPWIYAVLSFIGICTFVMLISGNAMKDLDRAGGGWGGVMSKAYTNCAKTGSGGGALGVILGWPLWKVLGSAGNWLGGAIAFLATAFCLLMMVNLTPARIRNLMTGRAKELRDHRQDERIQTEQQQLAWQQQQAMQQAAWQQEQQRRIIEQQQMFSQQNQMPQQNQMLQQNPYPQGGAPAQRPDVRNTAGTGVEAWQDQLTARQAAALPSNEPRQSRIFGRKDDRTAEKQDKTSLKDRLFGKKGEAYDGLVESRTEAAAEALRSAVAAEEAKASVRRTVTGEVITGPATRWNTATQDNRSKEPVSQVPVKPDYQTPADEIDNYRQPNSREQKKQAQNAKPAEELQSPMRPIREEADTGASRGKTRETKADDRQAVPAAPKKPVPAVQQTIGEEAYKAPLKVPPSAKEVRSPEDDYWTPTPYNYPPITDLAMPKAQTENTAQEDAMRSRKLEETLASFKVQARVVNVTHGPAISRFEMELAAGTKVSKVAELEKDIAYNMEATSVRIEAPIPGKSLVGVEVPNRKVATVTLREVLQSEKMQNAKSLLTVALGKDIAGTPIVCDLAKMPHMLIAGQTGSGKSVCINAIINSLLYRASPDEVKMILVDPKVVELQCYNGIPHLLIPVVNDPHKAAAALAWAVAEMMERYDKFAERRVRNLDGYNEKLGPHEKPMTRIVIIIDELADLMMVCKKDVEEYICRLTQLARAAGIHLIVATQRPSVDVITGLIKANIPSRIAFKTASYVDSRTILDRNGSEQLLGWGDMLYLPTGSFAPTRVQGCFLSDEEVNKIVGHVRGANPSTYDPDILEKLEEIASGGGTDMSGADMIGGASDIGGGDGSLFEQAVEFAIADGQISTSTLQRRLKIGYARAGRLTDEMEERGIVAAKDGSKPRKCLITREEWEEMKKAE